MLLEIWTNTSVVSSLCHCQDYGSCTDNLHLLTSNDLFVVRSTQFGSADVGFAAPVEVPMCVVYRYGFLVACRDTTFQ